MGQYHLVVNLTRKEYVDPASLGQGWKMCEFMGDGATARLLSVLLLDTTSVAIHDDEVTALHGRWVGDRVAVVGDYSENGDAPDAWYEGAGPGPSLGTVHDNIEAQCWVPLVFPGAAERLRLFDTAWWADAERAWSVLGGGRVARAPFARSAALLGLCTTRSPRGGGDFEPTPLLGAMLETGARFVAVAAAAAAAAHDVTAEVATALEK